MKKVITALAFFLSAFSVVAQHNSDYIQYLFNTILLNPAYAGSNDALNVTALYRQQWAGFDGTPQTITFSAHAPIFSKKTNVGFTAMNDSYGIYDHTRVNFAYAYRARIKNAYLSFGIQGGFDSYAANWSKVQTQEIGDPNFTAMAQRKTVPNAGFGSYLYNQKLFVGLAAPDLLNGNIDKYRTLILHGGYVFDVNENTKLKAALLEKYIYNSPHSTNISATVFYKNFIGIGAGYTIGNSFFALLDMRLNDQLRFGYGYNYNYTKIRAYSSGSHEVMLRYLFRYKVEPLSTRYF